MASPVSASIVPSEIGQFFTTVYGNAPQVSQDKKATAYSIPETGISLIADEYGGLHVDVKQVLPTVSATVCQAIETLFSGLKNKKADERKFDSLWVDFAWGTQPGGILPPSFVVGVPGKGDVIRDYQEHKVRFWQWLNPDKEYTIPTGPSHSMGAKALLADMVAQKVLLIVNQHRNKHDWNLPGGGYNPYRDSSPCDAALHEAQEEGGFTIEPERIPLPVVLGQIRFPRNQLAPSLNQIWGYFIDGISQKQLTPPPEEIKCAEWVPFSEILPKKGSYKGFKIAREITIGLTAAVHGLGFQQIESSEDMVVHAPVPPEEKQTYTQLS